MPQAKPIPDGLHTLQVVLTVKNAVEAIEWYTKALNAKERYRYDGPDGKIMHAEMQVGDSVLMLSDEMPEMKHLGPQPGQTVPVSVFMYTEDVDKIHESAIKNGAKPTMPVTDMFWGDRFGSFVDPFGHQWSIATHKEDLTPEQIKVRQEEAMKQMAAAAKK